MSANPKEVDRQIYDELNKNAASGNLVHAQNPNWQMIDANEIAPLSVTFPGRDEHSEGFWNHHVNTRETYEQLAAEYPALYEELKRGRSPEELRSDQKFEHAAKFWCSEDPALLDHYKGRYFCDDKGRHRTVLAQEHGFKIPVKVRECRERLPLKTPRSNRNACAEVKGVPDRERAVHAGSASSLRRPPQLAGFGRKSIATGIAANRDRTTEAPVRGGSTAATGLFLKTQPPKRTSSLRRPPRLSEPAIANDLEHAAGKTALAKHADTPSVSQTDKSKGDQPKRSSSLRRPPPLPPAPRPGQDRAAGRGR